MFGVLHEINIIFGQSHLKSGAVKEVRISKPLTF
jgi:hypothetical protein